MSVDTTTGVIEDALTDDEYTDLERLETTISKGLDTFVEVGNALAEIRDRKLYRQYHATFAAYCEEQWEMGKSQAYRLIDAADVVTELETSPNGDTVPLPTTEAQARALSEVAPEKRADVMKEATKDGPATGPKIRAAGAELDPALKLRQEQEAARAKARAEKEATDAAKQAERKQAEAEAAVLAAVKAEIEATDLSAHATAENGRVRSALRGLLDLDAATTAAYVDDIDRRLDRLAAVEQWCSEHRAALNSQGASIYVINGGA